MKMLFKGHSTRLEMLIEKIHSHKENSYQDSEVSGSTSSEIRITNSENLPDLNSDSPKSQSLSDTEEEKDWDDTKIIDSNDVSKTSFENDNRNDRVSEMNHLQYLCTFCPRLFKHKRSRDRHIKLHTGDKKYKCVQCESAFARSDHLKIHLKTHDLKKHYKCTRCHKSYNTVSALCFHEKSHKKHYGSVENSPVSNSENSFKPSQFSENYLGSNSTEKHSMTWNQDPEDKTDIKTICVYCFQWFSNIEIMVEHVRVFHRSFKNEFDDQKKCHLEININNTTKETVFENEFPSQENKLTMKRHKEEPSIGAISLKRNHYEEPLHSQETFICACCYERLPNFKSFLVHMETHVSSIKTPTCHQCGEEITDSSIKQALNSSMVPLSNYLCCCHCDNLFEDSESLQKHLLTHHVVTIYKCSICDQTFDDITSMKVHLKNNHVSSTEHFECNCNETPKLFHDRMSAELHFSKYHSGVEKLNHKCKITNRQNGILVQDVYGENAAKNSCYSFGTSGHRCAYCKEYCKTKNDLQIHLRSHQISDKSRHKCNICDDTFTSSTDLASHKLVHCKIVEGNICVQCKTVLLDEETFIKHQLKHNDTSKSTTKLNLILPSICIVCGQTLQSDHEIELHAKFHLKFLSEQARSNRVSESPYSEESVFLSDQSKNFGFGMDVSLELQCYLCKKTFTAKEKLQVHLIEHNFFGINQFSCYICSSVFTGALGLQGHLLEHNLTEKPYQCSQCSAGFFFRAELDNHRYIHNFKLQFDNFSEESLNQSRRFTSNWFTSETSESNTR